MVEAPVQAVPRSPLATSAAVGEQVAEVPVDPVEPLLPEVPVEPVLPPLQISLVGKQ